MARYTKESIKRAMRELICQGLEGHRPASFDAQSGAQAFLAVFPCEKCKRLVEVYIGALDLEFHEDWSGR